MQCNLHVQLGTCCAAKTGQARFSAYYDSPVHSRERHEALSVDLPCIVTLYTLNGAVADVAPVVLLFGALLKEVCHELRCRLPFIGVNVEATLVLLNDLDWAALVCGKGD